MLRLRGRGLRPGWLEGVVGAGVLVVKAAELIIGWVVAGSAPAPAAATWLLIDSLATAVLAFGVVWATRVYINRSLRSSHSTTQGVRDGVQDVAHAVEDAAATVLKVAHSLEAESSKRRTDHEWLKAQIHEIRTDIAEVRSDTEFLASQVTRPNVSGAPRRVLMVTSNGAGLGHLTRCLALAREFPAEWTVDILTLSTGWRKVANEGVNLHYFPSKQALGLMQRQWHRRFARAVSNIVDEINPDVMFFDGTALYRGVYEVPRQRFIPLVWIVRGGWKKGVTNEQTKFPERFADGLLLPGDHAIGEEVAPVAVDTLPVLRTPPLFYAPQLLRGSDARDQLGLAEGVRYVLLQLGAGNIDRIGDKLLAAAEAVEQLGPEWRAVVVDSPIARKTDVLPPQVKRISAYPLSAYYRAFEFVVVAAGYNTVQEVLALRVPALIVPNLETITDDQARRAEAAAASGMSLCVRTAEEIPAAIRSLGNESTRSGLRQAMSALDTRHDVPELGSWVEEVMVKSQSRCRVATQTRASGSDEVNGVAQLSGDGTPPRLRADISIGNVMDRVDRASSHVAVDSGARRDPWPPSEQAHWLDNSGELSHRAHPINLDHPCWNRIKVDSWALISESTVAVEYLSAIASRGKMNFEQLQRAVARRELSGIDAQWLARLARIVALQSSQQDAVQCAIDALQQAVPSMVWDNSTIPLRKLLIELMFREGDVSGAARLLSSYPDLADYYHGYLAADLINPFVTGDPSSFDQWLSLLNRVFLHYGLAPVSVDRDPQLPFNSLTVINPPPVVEDGPLVSVVMTSFNPDTTDFRASVASILNQTWRNLELVIVDDCSTRLPPNLLTEIQDSDPRVRVLRLEENGGTYRARNKGILAAHGEFVTGQDTDDWSHPERVERQVNAFVNRPDLSGVMTSANRTDDRLVRMSPGFDCHRKCEASLLYRRSDAVSVGGYLPIRKGADSEFRERLERWSELPVLVLDEPLYIIRLTAGSLSRSDFRAGWSHHARRAFSSAYKYWHSAAAHAELELDIADDGTSLPFVVPSRLRGGTSSVPGYDVCFVNDWRLQGNSVDQALAEIGAAVRSGLRVGVLQMETPYSQLGATRVLVHGIQKLINSGTIGQLFLDETADVDLMLVRDPAVLDYAKRARSELRVRQCLLVSTDTSVTNPGGVLRYVPQHAQEMGMSVFGVEPLWAVPLGSTNESFAATYALPVLDQPYPLIVDLAHQPAGRPPHVNAGLRIGRTATGSRLDWPSDGVALRVAYPTDGSAEVRILGDAGGALQVLGDTAMAPSWLNFSHDDMRPDVFWRTVDYAVQFDGRGISSDSLREMVGALASGTVVITSPDHEGFFGDSVLVGEPHDVPRLLQSVPVASEAYRLQVQRGARFVHEQLSEEAFMDFLREAMSTQQIVSL